MPTELHHNELVHCKSVKVGLTSAASTLNVQASVTSEREYHGRLAAAILRRSTIWQAAARRRGRRRRGRAEVVDSRSESSRRTLDTLLVQLEARIRDPGSTAFGTAQTFDNLGADQRSRITFAIGVAVSRRRKRLV